MRIHEPGIYTTCSGRQAIVEGVLHELNKAYGYIVYFCGPTRYTASETKQDSLQLAAAWDLGNGHAITDHPLIMEENTDLFAFIGEDKTESTTRP